MKFKYLYKKFSKLQDFVKYRLDRLGIPLLEIATEPDFKDAETASEAAFKIGQILRATGKVFSLWRRGGSLSNCGTRQ